MCLVLHFEKPPGTMNVYMHGKTCDTRPMRSYCFVHEEKDFYYENSWHSKRRAHFRYDMDDICITHCLSLLVFQMMNLMSHIAERKNLGIFFHSATKHNSTLWRYTCMREVFVHRPTTSKWLLEVAAFRFVLSLFCALLFAFHLLQCAGGVTVLLFEEENTSASTAAEK